MILFNSDIAAHDPFPKKVSSAVLSGTKYGLKQTRGKFGLGAKMVRSEIGLDLII